MKTNDHHEPIDGEVRDILAEAGYSTLGNIPMLGTLIKTAVELHRHSQRRRLALFAKKLIEGLAPEDAMLADLEGREGESFKQILQSLLSDRDEEKATLYAMIYANLMKYRLFENNRPLAEFIVEAAQAITLYDVALMNEIDETVRSRPSAEIMRAYFLRLEHTRTPKDRGGFDWRRRLSVQNLVRLGMLAKVEPGEPLWTTEHFDVVMTAIRGIEGRRDHIVKRTESAQPSPVS